MIPSDQSNFDEVPDKCRSLNNLESNEGEDSRKSSEVNLFSPGLGEHITEKGPSCQQDKLQLLVDFVSLDDWDFDVVPLQSQPNVEETKNILFVQPEKSYKITESKRKMGSPFNILKDYDKTLRRLKTEKNMSVKTNYKTECIKAKECKSSTVEILRLGAEKFIQSFTISDQESYMLSHPFASSFVGLSEEDTRSVALVENLLASAEKVENGQFDRARKILDNCDKFCSVTGNPIERIVYYFSQALHDRINWETGRDTTKGIGKKRLEHIENTLMSLSPCMIAAHQSVPLSQVSQFTAVQAIIDHVAESEKVHIIDLEIGSGMQWTILMQALATHQCESSIKHLKITALCTKLRHKIENTLERLMSFAKSLNLPFSFNIVMVADVMELKQEDFELDSEEATAVFSRYYLMRMLVRPDKLDSLMRVIKGINPRIMIITEVEANHNSPVFVDRFVEALFFYGAFFDLLEDCMKHDEKSRIATESEYLSQGIRSIVAAEGEERTIRHVKIDVWRTFFARYGMEAVELSKSSMYQANLVLKNFDCGSSCTLDKNHNCLIIGWKGTPINSLSAWKFS